MYLKFRKPGKKAATKQIDPEGTPFEEVIDEKTVTTKDPDMEQETIIVEEEDLNNATRIVVKRVMEVIHPMLEKLNTAAAQYKKEAEAGRDSNTDDPLVKLQEAATERLALQERKVAARLGKIQARIAKTK